MGKSIIFTVDYFPPVIADPYGFGQIAACNAISDIYAMGGEPKLALNITMFPKDTYLKMLCEKYPYLKETGRFALNLDTDEYELAMSLDKADCVAGTLKSIANYFSEMQEKGELPLRVTHNDTKLNNIMIDDKTGKGICVIDLDTVMPGLAMNDFGDSIRFGASTAAEDERDLSLVSCSMELFDIYARGFIEGCGGKLTEREILELPMGAKTMTYECGMRFLTDYLQGDTYFKIHRKDHNLDRCRTQFKLVEDMEQKWHTMQAIVRKYM